MNTSKSSEGWASLRVGRLSQVGHQVHELTDDAKRIRMGLLATRVACAGGGVEKAIRASIHAARPRRPWSGAVPTSPTIRSAGGAESALTGPTATAAWKVAADQSARQEPLPPN